MAIRIGKSIFLEAYQTPKNHKQIYFTHGKAATASRSVKVKHQASLSHKLYDLRHHLEKKSKNNDRLANIANTIYGEEHKHYGCITKIVYCFNNLFRGRGFHDEEYFFNQIKPFITDSEESKTDPAASTTETPKEEKKQKDPATSLPAYFDAVDNLCAETVEKNKGVYKILSNPNYSVYKAFKKLPSKRQAEMLQVLNDVIKAFQDNKFKNKYHQSPYTKIPRINPGDKVPQYFAHVAAHQQSDWERKYLSLCGIRNLLLHGPKIIDDLKEKKFIDGFANYSSGKGLKALQYYTGNTVDLNVEIEASDDKEAIAEAKKRIVNFGKMCGLKNATTAEKVASSLPSRKLRIQQDPYYGEFVHDSGTDYKDRGNYGIWKRNNNYYVNVPDVDAAIPAILRLPYMIAEMASMDKEKNSGQFSDKFLDDLFANISTKCFNNKLQQLNRMYSEWKSTGGLDEKELAAKALADLSKKIEKGKFGEKIKAKGFAAAMKEARTRDDLLMMITSDEDRLYDYIMDDGQHCPKGVGDKLAQAWAEKHLDFFKQYFKEQKMYKQSLYRTDNDSPYVIFDKKALRECLIGLYNALAF